MALPMMEIAEQLLELQEQQLLFPTHLILIIQTIMELGEQEPIILQELEIEE